jgi:hypothetical protein
MFIILYFVVPNRFPLMGLCPASSSARTCCTASSSCNPRTFFSMVVAAAIRWQAIKTASSTMSSWDTARLYGQSHSEKRRGQQEAGAWDFPVAAFGISLLIMVLSDGIAIG